MISKLLPYSDFPPPDPLGFQIGIGELSREG